MIEGGNIILFENDKNPMKSWWNTQEQLVNLWKDSLGKMGTLWSQGLPYGSVYQDWMKGFASGYRGFMNFLPLSISSDTFERMMQAGEIANHLLFLWHSIFVNLPDKDDIEKWKEFSKSWLENYNRILDYSLSLHFPEPFRSLLKTPAEMGELSQKVIFNFLQPWVEASKNLQVKYLEAVKGDREAYLDFIKLWNEAYQNSFGKMLRLPAFGWSREALESWSASTDSFMKHLAATNKFLAAILKTGQDVMEHLLKKIVEMAEKGQAPSTFNEFYQLWWRTNEEAYLELFKTDIFSRLIGETVDAWVLFKKQYDNLIDDLISQSLPIPTSKEMDDLYKTVYQVRKTVKEHSMKIEKLDALMESQSTKGSDYQ
ncbi:MAG: poly(R)-hydroxyalkanoic acid synthase subunit PhaE [Dethiobacteria bacterium]|jgi:hypothetical protein